MIREQVLQRVVSRSVKDIYGRPAGSVLGYTVDATGALRTIGIEHGGAFTEYSAEQIIIDNDSMVLVPRWRSDVEKLSRIKGTVAKRAQALEELRAEGEIPQHVYESMKSQLDEDSSKLQSSHSSMKEALEKRSADLTKRRAALERFVAGIMVQHRSGEIDDAAYDASKNNVVEILGQDDREQADLKNALKLLSSETSGQDGTYAPAVQQQTAVP
ncbi:MAG: CdvA-like protein [Thaumarchaeota archaeon]|nr:CdvA-like protein [Nitrososphaerota archaeon]